VVGRSTSDRPPTEAAMITPPRSSRACFCSSRRPLPTNTTLQPRRADQCRQGTTAKCSRTSSRCSSRCPGGLPPAVAARTPAGSSPPSARKRCLVEHGAGQKVASRFPAVGLFTVFRSQQRHVARVALFARQAARVPKSAGMLGRDEGGRRCPATSHHAARARRKHARPDGGIPPRAPRRRRAAHLPDDDP